jgi:hypothetical protein
MVAWLETVEAQKFVGRSVSLTDRVRALENQQHHRDILRKAFKAIVKTGSPLPSPVKREDSIEPPYFSLDYCVELAGLKGASDFLLKVLNYPKQVFHPRTVNKVIDGLLKQP